MTPQTAIELHFGDGEYLCDLRLPQMAELQDKRGIGIFALYARVLKGRYLFQGETIGATNEGEAYAEDLFETIRLGLIGGGRGMVDGKEIDVSPLLARKLVERYGWEAPLRDSWAVAAAILGARIEGYTPPGEASAGESPATPSPQSNSEKSSPTVEPSGSTGAS